MKAREFDKLFDDGKEDILQYFDVSKAIRVKSPARIQLDLPSWLLDSIDREAERQSVNRNTLIRAWLAEKLDHK